EGEPRGPLRRHRRRHGEGPRGLSRVDAARASGEGRTAAPALARSSEPADGRGVPAAVGWILTVLAAGLALSLVLRGPQDSRPSGPPVPVPGELNPAILRVFESYPQDGSHGYWWPKGSAWEGTTRDLFYLGRKIATGDPQKRSYCCGFTFEV